MRWIEQRVLLLRTWQVLNEIACKALTIETKTQGAGKKRGLSLSYEASIVSGQDHCGGFFVFSFTPPPSPSYCCQIKHSPNADVINNFRDSPLLVAWVLMYLACCARSSVACPHPNHQPQPKPVHNGYNEPNGLHNSYLHGSFLPSVTSVPSTCAQHSVSLLSHLESSPSPSCTCTHPRLD